MKIPLRLQGWGNWALKFFCMYNYSTYRHARQLRKNVEINREEYRYKPKKSMAVYYAVLFRLAGLERQSGNVYYCSRDICTDDNYKLKSISACRTRLCPMCSWRLSLKTYKVIRRITSEIAERHSKDFVFITLALRNCTAQELDSTISNLLQSFRRLYLLADMRAAFDGMVRTLEVTYNAAADTYHPHLHVIAHCQDGYYTREAGIYMAQPHLLDLWQQCLRVDYLPTAHIQVLRGRTDAELAKSIAEVSKYCVKGTDFTAAGLTQQEQASVLGVLYHALHGRRLLSYQGLFRKIKRELLLDETDYTDITDEDITAAERVFKWVYSKQEYWELIGDDAAGEIQDGAD